jgi:hypothetical protein
MLERKYRASLSQSQGREGWSIIFRHPSVLTGSAGNLGTEYAVVWVRETGTKHSGWLTR